MQACLQAYLQVKYFPTEKEDEILNLWFGESWQQLLAYGRDFAGMVPKEVATNSKLALCVQL